MCGRNSGCDAGAVVLHFDHWQANRREPPRSRHAPPGSENLMALDTTLPSTCCSRSGSPQTRDRSCRSSVQRDGSFPGRRPAQLHHATRTGRRASTSLRVDGHLAGGRTRHVQQVVHQPRLQRRVAFDDVERPRQDHRRYRSLPCLSCHSQLLITCSGVRNSCDSNARNSSLSRLALSAAFARLALLAQRRLQVRVELHVVQRQRRGIREALQHADLHGRGHVIGGPVGADRRDRDPHAAPAPSPGSSRTWADRRRAGCGRRSRCPGSRHAGVEHRPAGNAGFDRETAGPSTTARSRLRRRNNSDFPCGARR